jgi:hypothetical protein
MTWIETIGARKFDFLDSDPGAIDLSDIGDALSNQNRFTGHTAHGYSVAEHSLWVWKLVAIRSPGDYLRQLHAVLHDAAEAYVGDVSRPLKEAMRQIALSGMSSPFDLIEESVQRVIYTRFGLPLPDARTRELIKLFDMQMLATEHHCPALMPKAGALKWDEPEPHEGLLDGTVVLTPDEMIPEDWKPMSFPEHVRFPALVGLQRPPPLASLAPIPLDVGSLAVLFRGTIQRLLELTKDQRFPEVA